MTSETVFWLISTLSWTLLMSFYSTQEMACISFNKLRLEYYVTEKKKWAIQLHNLLKHPTGLFCTTLLGVNLALMASSECARRLYESLGWNPNLAPLTQIPFVLIFGELVPMFAARVYSEHTAKLGMPLLSLSAKLLTPISNIVDLLFQQLNRLMGGRQMKEPTAFLSRDELQRMIEESELPKTASEAQHVNDIIANIFSIRNKQAFQLMERLVQIPCISTQTTIKDLRTIFQTTECTYIPVYHRYKQKIIGIVRPQDVLEAQENKKIADFVQSVSFVSENTTGFELIKLLQRQNPSVGLVLNSTGIPVGIISIDTIFEELFSQEDDKNALSTPYHIEKSFPADTSIVDFNEAYGLRIDSQGCRTFAELIEHILGRAAAPHDALFIEPVEIIVKEISLFKAKTILIRTRFM